MEPNLGQLAPPNAKIIPSAASFTKPCGVSKVATLFDKDFSFQRFLRKTPNSSSFVIQFRSNGDAFISFGKTRPVEPIKVCIPKEFAHLITSFGPNSSNALSIKLPLCVTFFWKTTLSSCMVRFSPDFPAIRNFLPKVGMESTRVTFTPLRIAKSAAISPVGPPPTISIFLLVILYVYIQ